MKNPANNIETNIIIATNNANLRLGELSEEYNLGSILYNTDKTNKNIKIHNI